MIKCVSNKRVYQSKELAEEALIESHSQFEHRGGGPIAVYQCEDCGYFHLTSKGQMNQRLAELIKEGKIGRAREANQWLRKIKRK
ncbi:MAG TPA: hypothetical protein VFU05_01710 [Cyclobacteriaceae bacterium]|nr:hypothetical protein [Cyclobacteriaceae bacterium]